MRVLTDLFFNGVSRVRRALLGLEIPQVNSEIGYDDVAKRVRVHDGTNAKKLLQENDIDTNIALGVSNEKVPSQNAVKQYIDTLISNVGIQPPQPFDATTATTFPSGTAGDSYVVTASGTVQGTALEIGDWFFSASETANSTPEDWIILQRNIDKASEALYGLVRLATTQEALDGLDGEKVITPSTLASVISDLDIQAGLPSLTEDNTWIGNTLNEATEIPIAQSYLTKEVLALGEFFYLNTAISPNSLAFATPTQNGVLNGRLRCEITSGQVKVYSTSSTDTTEFSLFIIF